MPTDDDNTPPTNLELAAGPGGVGTPTPEPGPTPTPQDDPAGLKPLGELLGQKAKEADDEVKPPAAANDAPVVPEPKRSDPAERINKLTAEKWDERRRREDAEAQLKLAQDTLAEIARLDPTLLQPKEGGEKPAAAPAQRTFTQADLEAEGRRQAQVISFNQSVDKEVIAGRAAHPDYDNAVAELKRITGPVIPYEFVAAALQTGEASEVIYQLGKNPAEADRILSLSPIPMAVALAQYAGEIKSARGSEPTAADVSRAPPPIKPRVGGKAKVEPTLEEMPIADFIAKRNEQERTARAAMRR